MKEHPILFRPDMVKAILEGRKTQTRRVLNPQPPQGYELFQTGLFYVFTPAGRRGPGVEGWTIRCPYVHIDRLWVRERADYIDRGAGGGYVPTVVYHADKAECRIPPEHEGDFARPVSRNSIHMPRWASRLSIDITGIRAERIQTISEEDAEAEGCERSGPNDEHGDERSFYQGYGELWDRMRAGTPLAWNCNPWVWVIEFKRLP